MGYSLRQGAAVRLPFVMVFLALAESVCRLSPVSGDELALQAARFRVDLTPDAGDGPCVGFMRTIERIEHPLELRGLILSTGQETYVLAALDYSGLCNSSDDVLRSALAIAAGTTPQHVALQSLHQHTAPVLDLDAVKILHGEDSPQVRQHVAFTEKLATRIAAGIRESQSGKQAVTRIVASRAKAERLASNRRVPQPDGSLLVRGSSTTIAALHEAPEGLIDPWVRTLTFFSGEHPVAQVHYYATHPQSYYGDARITWDVPGIARQRLEDESGVFQIYFNGCGGNIGMGKYNNGSAAAREELSLRMYQALKASAEAANNSSADVAYSCERLTAKDIGWQVADLKFTVRTDGPFAPAAIQDQLQAAQPWPTRLKAAMYQAWAERLRAGHTVKVSRLRIGPIQIIHLPGEPFVEFQLFAQRQAPESFVCVAGYGECGVWYYGPDSIFTDRGGYEQTWSFTGPIQKPVEALLTGLLR